jgi:hypothetical protein
MKLARAVEEINKLLVPLTEAEDELKKRQLMELAIINGTYRDNSAIHSKNALAQAAANQYFVDPARLSLALAAGQFRQQTLGAPLMMQSRHQMNQMNQMNQMTNQMSAAGNSPYYMTNQQMTDVGAAAAAAAAAGLLYNPFDYSASLAASLMQGEYHMDHHGSVGGFLHPR